MRASFLLGDERRDVTDRPGKRPRRPRRKASAADIALRVELPQEFVTSPDQGGRRRLLQRFGLANLAPPNYTPGSVPPNSIEWTK